MIVRSFLLLSFLVVPAILIRPGLLNYKRVSSDNANEKATVSVTAAYFTQFLNHFSSNDGNFTQKYYYSEQYATNKKIAFLFVSDNTNFENSVLSDERYPIVKNAKQFGATMFALEHRYYGSSKPFATFDAHNLRFLNSLQAVEDLNIFIKFANTQFKFDSDVKWILWGAGYGGVLAAEARRSRPDTVTGVISSSAPLKHKYDFWEFNDHVAFVLKSINQTCHDNIKKGFADIATSITTTEGRASISDTFQLNPRLDATNLTYNDIQQFYQQIIAPFQDFVLFNAELGIKISDMCNVMANTTSTPTQNIYNVWQFLNNLVAGGQGQLITSYPEIIALLGNPNITSPLIEARLWQWQICTEFGYFYTTNTQENQIFGATVPTSLYLNQCFDIFPDAFLSATSIRDSVTNFNNYYGGNNAYSGTNAVFTNGAYDPFSRLGKETTTDFSVVTYVIPMASYASDFFPIVSDNFYILQAHELMSSNIEKWFNSPPNPVKSVNTTIPWTRPNVIVDVSIPVNDRFTDLPEDIPSKKTYSKPKLSKKMIMGRPPHGFKPAPSMDASMDAIPAGFEQGMFKQREDHFNNSNPNFFQQKFFKNSQWAQPGGPNFLMIGGEGPESSRWVLNENITYLTWAQKYGATVYLLEHRFYGDSRVGSQNNDFSKLSSLQMLYDLAEFIRSVNQKTGTTAPWITFGGSYSGAMSAWMREVFPDLVAGAVASSGPVYAKTDFYEYLMVVENSIRMYSEDCAGRIKSAFDVLNQLFQTTDGRKQLSDVFTLVPAFGDVVREVDKHYFFNAIYGNFQGAVQYSGDNTGPYANGYGIPDMCKIMLNDTNTPLQNVANFNVFMTKFYNDGTFDGTDNKYEDMIDGLKTAQNFGPESAAGLLWTWQTCSEFGYFQSDDAGNGIFGAAAPVNMYIQMCIDVFGDQYNRPYVDSVIDYTNYKYGSRDFYRGTNVVLPNGNVDPWHALGLYYPIDPSVVSYLINGTAHCADMYPARPEDVPGLKVVRDLVDTNIARWLSGEPAPTSNSNVTVSTVTTANPLDVTTQGSSSISIMITIAVAALHIFI